MEVSRLGMWSSQGRPIETDNKTPWARQAEVETETNKGTKGGWTRLGRERQTAGMLVTKKTRLTLNSHGEGPKYRQAEAIAKEAWRRMVGVPGKQSHAHRRGCGRPVTNVIACSKYNTLDKIP